MVKMVKNGNMGNTATTFLRQCAFKRIKIQIVIDIVLYVTVALPMLYLFLRGVPYENGFFCGDPELSYPNKPDTISTAVLIVVGFGISVVVVVVVEVLNAIERRCRNHYSNTGCFVFCIKGYGLFLFGFVVQQFIVEIVKNHTGSFRPNFFSVCHPLFNQSECPGYIRDFVCNASENNAKEIRDSRLSFPSGHSAFSMYIAIYFCMYVQKRCEISFSHTLKFCLQASLLLQTILCGISRVWDNKHRPSDVIAGFGLGLVVSGALFRFVGEKVLTDQETYLDKERLNENKSTSGCCCSITQIETQTTTSLLANDYWRGIRNYEVPILKADYNIRRHMSTPRTSTSSLSHM